MRKVMLYVKYFREEGWEPAWDKPRLVSDLGQETQREINKLLEGNLYPLDNDGIVGYELREVAR